MTVKFEKNYNLFNLKFSCMKKKLIFAGAVVLMAAAAVTAYMANYRPDPFDLLNANIEALAQDEGTSVGSCYVSGYGGTHSWLPECNRETSIHEIFPCPTIQSYIAPTASSMCTK